jgi:hypothetical protein
MRITICGSMHFSKEMLKTQQELQRLGHEVTVPSDAQIIAEGKHDIADKEANVRHCREKDILRTDFGKVARSDGILVLNHRKKGIDGYVGGNTLIEIGLAYYLGKKIFLLNPQPHDGDLSYAHEIEIMQPVVINGDLKKIK